MKLVKVRLSGDTIALGAALALLVSAAQSGGAEIAEQSALYPNRRDPGYRVYLTLAVPDSSGTNHDASAPAAGDASRPDGTSQRGAAHHRQAIRRPAAPITAKESQGRKHLP